MSIKPIETKYRGVKFRSRTEARWAVYFDCIGLKWVYELEGFDLDGTYYLPDFWLSDVNMWAEVKPTVFLEEELNKCRHLSKLTNYSSLLLEGPPSLRSYWVISPDMPKDTHPKDWGNDAVISMYHNYPIDEHRFYMCTGGDPEDISKDYYMFDDISKAVEIAKSARFEYGETPDLTSIKEILNTLKKDK